MVDLGTSPLWPRDDRHVKGGDGSKVRLHERDSPCPDDVFTLLSRKLATNLINTWL